MYKYLSFIIGIILYLLLNNNDKFSVGSIGGLNETCELDVGSEILDDHCNRPLVCVIDKDPRTIQPQTTEPYWIREDPDNILKGKCVKKRWENDKGDSYFYPSIYNRPLDAPGIGQAVCGAINEDYGGGIYETTENIRLQNILTNNLSKTSFASLDEYSFGCSETGITYPGMLECLIDSKGVNPEPADYICETNHRANNCKIDNTNIDLVDIKDIPDYKTLNTSGFQYFSNQDSGIEMDGEEMRNYIDIINEKHADGNYNINELIYNNLHLYEYLYMKYLEIKYAPFKAKKIMNNIYYINNKIIYILTENFFKKVMKCGALMYSYENDAQSIDLCRTATSQVYGIRLSMGDYVELNDVTNSPTDSNIIMPPSSQRLGMSPNLHIDYNSFDKYEKLDTDDDRFNKYANKTVTESFFSTTEDDSMYQQMDGFFDNNIEILNIWIMLDCSENAKSLSFLDLGNTDKERILYNLSMKESGLYKYVFGLGINYGRILRDDTLYNTFYTFGNMLKGDFLVFKSSEVPHTAVIQDNNTWRISCEVRYAIYEDEVPFDIGINGVFDDTNEPISPTDKFNPKYFRDNILIFFQMEYVRVKNLYNLQLGSIGSGKFNLDIFKNIIDSISYKEYLKDEKVTEYIVKTG